MSESGETSRRAIRSYVLRQGRLTPGQQNALAELWPVYGLTTDMGQLDLSTLFARQQPICLEIGFGMGESLAEQASSNPNTNYIGIEVHRPGVGHLLMLAGNLKLANLRVFAQDSLEVLAQSLPDKSLASVQVFFPDPWHKKRHHKRRLINEEFLGLMIQKLAPAGLLHIATDWRPYAEEIEALLVNFPRFQPEAAPDRPETKFERRGLGLGHDITDLAYRLVDQQQ